MNRDPIFNLIGIYYRRSMLFIILSLLFATCLWLWVLLQELNVGTNDLLVWLRAARTQIGADKLPIVILYGSLTIGVLATSVLFLIVGTLWKKRATVAHHRGARLNDTLP